MFLFSWIRRVWKSFLNGPSWLSLPSWLTLSRFHYRSSSALLFIWGYALYARLFSAQGRALLFVFLIVGFFSTIVMNSPVLAVFFGMTAIFALDFLLKLLFFPRLSAERDMPQRVQCGVPFKIRYNVKNLRSLPLWDLCIDPNLSFHGMIRRESIPFLQMDPGKEQSIEIVCQTCVRGVFPVNGLLCETHFPFNIFKFSRAFGGIDTIIAHPQYRDFDLIETVGGQKLGNRAFELKKVNDQSMDFHGCRDFRYGDTRRKIHWRASAKYGSLIVKEFTEENSMSASMIIDNYHQSKEFHIDGISSILKALSSDIREDYSLFEQVISFAASLTVAAGKRNHLLKHLIIGNQMTDVPSENQETQTLQVFDLLATANLSRQVLLPKISPSDLDEIASSGVVFLVLGHYGKDVQELYHSLMMRGANLHAYLISPSAPPNLQWLQVIPPNLVLGEEES